MTAYIPLLADAGPGGFVLETAVCELDTQGIVRRWGAGAERVFGFTEREAVGQILPMVPYDLHAETIERIREAAGGGSLPEQATVWCRNEGEPLEAPVSVAKRGANGQGPSVALIARAISERRFEQAQLSASAKDR